MEETLVQQNLMTREYYAPYCLACSTMLRVKFNGDQFVCSKCGWVSKFPLDFIKRYKKRWSL